MNMNFGWNETEDLLAPWNDQLAQLGTEIHTARTDYTARINDALDHTLFEPAALQIGYSSSLEGKGNLDSYEPLLRERLQLRVTAGSRCRPIFGWSA